MNYSLQILVARSLLNLREILNHKLYIIPQCNNVRRVKSDIRSMNLEFRIEVELHSSLVFNLSESKKKDLTGPSFM